MSEAADAGGPGDRQTPRSAARERYGHDWGMLFLKGKAAAGAGRDGRRAGEAVGGPAISWSDGVVHVRDRRLIDAADRGACRQFVERVFRLPEVSAVELNWIDGTVSVHYRRPGQGAAQMLERLAAAARGEAVEGAVSDVEPWSPRSGAPPLVKWFRHGRRLSTTEVASESPGRMRFRHPALAGNRELAHRIEAELATVHGVSEVHARPLTASVLVRFDPAVLSHRHLVELVDDFLKGPTPAAPAEVHPPAVAFGLANASLGLAAVGELAVPALLPASAVLLVVANASVIREGVRELGRRQLGLPLLYTAIVAGTLGTGQHLGAALMSWMFKFWRHRHRVDQFQLRRQLLPALTQRPRFARLCAGGESVRVRTDGLRPGDRIVVEKSEIIPADGRLLSGPVLVDERLAGGASGLTRKRTGDLVFAGSWPVEGELELEVSGHGRATRAARLGRELAAATVLMPTAMSVTARGEAFAQRAVAPTLAAAGVGLLVGDLVTASAILRPDFATGPGLGASAAPSRDTAACARDGVLIRDATAFERLAAADVWVFDDYPALERAGLEVDRIEGHSENMLLQLAATAFRDLADQRAAALLTACRAGGIPLLPIAPSYQGLDITLDDGSTCVTIQDARSLNDRPPPHPALLLMVDGQVAGRIGFRPASRPRIAAAIEELRRQGPMAAGLVSDRRVSDAGVLAAELGLDFHHGGLTSAAKADLLRAFRDRGLKVAYVGDCRREPAAAREAHVAISLADDFDPEHDPGQILILRPDFDWLPALRELSLAHVGRVRTAHRAILLPNLLCIAGAFFLGFTSFSAVVITNLGTWAVYSGLPERRRKPGAAIVPHSLIPQRSEP